METAQKKVLIAPLNWGLGHATRCIPIINALIKYNFTPVIASDGVALELLKKEFPTLQTLELPSYEIEYAKEGKNFKWKMLHNSPRIIESVLEEHAVVKAWVKEYKFAGIISDNRLGVFSKKVPSVFITHQLNVLSGNTSWITTMLHTMAIKKFTECWVPDFKKKPNLTGKLGHTRRRKLKIQYLGPLSRLEKQKLPLQNDLMVILSGPEPQRTMLEEKLRSELQSYKGQVAFVRGVMQSERISETEGNVTYHNFMQSEELQRTFNESKMVLCRSGYTTVMDLSCLGKQAFFIPTPGQYEQEYLAKRFEHKGLVPSATQDKFKIEMLSEIKRYKGLPEVAQQTDWKKLFCLFEGE